MSNPTPPDIDYSYAGFQQEQQDFPFPGTQLDNDLAELSNSIGETITALEDIRRADGALQNSIVTADSLDESLLIGLKTPTVWAASTRYAILDTVIADSGIYRCIVSHESADFDDDFAAGYWELIFELSPTVPANLPAYRFVGDGVTTDWPVGNNPGGLNNILVSVGGVFQLSQELSLVQGDTNYVRITPAVPNLVKIEIRTLVATTVLDVPADGSVGLPQLDADIAAILDTALTALQPTGENVTASIRQRDWPQTPYASSVVDDDFYSHFPVIAGGFDVLGVLYHYGKNHGQGDTAAICASQTPAAGGTQSLTINGNETAGGIVTGVLGETRITVTSAGNDTARTFAVTGTSGGAPVVRSGLGGNADTVTLTGNIDPNSITLVTVDGNTAGAVTVGLERIASDIAYKYSEDGGATWSSRIRLGDGMTAGQTVYYSPALGRRKNGSLIAIFLGIDVTTGVRTLYQTTSFTGKDDWTDLAVMDIIGSPSAGSAWYGQIKTLPSGGLVASQFIGEDNYVVVSDDWEGTSWTAHLVVNSSSPNFTEQAIAIIDENNWLCLLRADGITGMRTCKTADRGVTWTVPAETNLPASSGYQSHELNTIDVDGVRYVIMTYMARDAGTDPPTIDAICTRWTTATLALAAATNWGAEVALVTSLEDRSGYPSVFINPDSGNTLMVYGKETAERTAEVRTIAVDFAARIQALARSGGYADAVSWTPVLTCATPGDLVATLSSAVGTVTKVGKLRFVTFELITSTFTRTTATGQLRISGLPDLSAITRIGGDLEWSGITKVGYTSFAPRIGANGTNISFRSSGSGVGSVDLAITDLPSGGAVRLLGTLWYNAV